MKVARSSLIGDQKSDTSTISESDDGTNDGGRLDRPLYLPSLDSGLQAALPATVTAVTSITGDALPGVCFEEVGPVVMKGIPEPVPLYRAVRG